MVQGCEGSRSISQFPSRPESLIQPLLLFPTRYAKKKKKPIHVRLGLVSFYN